MELNEKINYEAEVRKVYPDAKCKRVGEDNGHGIGYVYVVFKCDSLLRGDAISIPCFTAKSSWKYVYQNILNSQKTNNEQDRTS